MNSSSKQLLMAFAASVLTGATAQAGHGEIVCRDQANEITISIKDVPDQVLGEKAWLDLEVQALVTSPAKYNIVSNKDLVDARAVGGIGTEAGQLVIALREVSTKHLVVLRTTRFDSDGFAKGHIEGGASVDRFPVACVWNNLGPVVKRSAVNGKYCPDAHTGQPCLMSEKQAEQYCADRGSHLPDVREFARFSVGYGAKGMSTQPSASSYKVASRTSSGTIDSFYFDHNGFKAPNDGASELSFWTSSVTAGNPKYAHVFYGSFGGGGGSPDEHHRSYRHAVRCATSR